MKLQGSLTATALVTHHKLLSCISILKIFWYPPAPAHQAKAQQVSLVFGVRDSETTITKTAFLRGLSLGGREENDPKTLFCVGNATTVDF